MNETELLSTQLITHYLDCIRHNGSQISEADRGLFPSYWFNPYQIIVFKNTLDDLAIVLKRRVSGRIDRISVRQFNGRIENTVFPGLTCRNGAAMFVIPDCVCKSSIQSLTLRTNSFCPIIIGFGCEFRLIEVRIEANAKEYPREFEYLWFLTSPNKCYLTKENAQSTADEDFWGKINHLLTIGMKDIFSVDLGKKTIETFIQYLSKIEVEMGALISRQDLAEQQLQAFLEKYFFLLFNGKPIVKKFRDIGIYKTDFTLQLADDAVMLIEIQLNNDPIIVNDKPSKGFQEAIVQTSTWFDWIEHNDFKNFIKHSGKIIIGRKTDYLKNKQIVDEIVAKFKYPVTLETYDNLHENLSMFIEAIKRLLRKEHTQDNKSL